MPNFLTRQSAKACALVLLHKLLSSSSSAGSLSEGNICVGNLGPAPAPPSPARVRQLPGPSQERGRCKSRTWKCELEPPECHQSSSFQEGENQGRKFRKRREKSIVSSHVSTASQEPGTLGRKAGRVRSVERGTPSRSRETKDSKETEQ